MLRMPVQASACAANAHGPSPAAGGEKFLDTREHELHWWQLALLDVYLVLALAGLLACGAALGLLWLSYRACLRLLISSKGNSKGKGKAKAM